MRSYNHPNSAITPHPLDGETLAIYHAIRDGQPVTIPVTIYTPERLYLLAERFACDDAARWLVAQGVDARIIDIERETISWHPVAVQITGTYELCMVDAEAARRILQRVQAGLSVDEAITRTLAMCEQPVLSEFAISELERKADNHVRRLALEDARVLK